MAASAPRLALATLLLCLPALLLAGCSSGPDPVRYSSLCQRTLSNSSAEITGSFYPQETATTRTDVLAKELEESGRPLAAVTVVFGKDRLPDGRVVDHVVAVQDGQLRLHFEREGTGERLSAYRNLTLSDVADSWTFPAGRTTGFNLTIAFDGDGVAEPDVVKAVWTFERDADGDEGTESAALMRIGVRRWYQDCPE